MRAVRECERSEYSLVCAYALTQLATHPLIRTVLSQSILPESFDSRSLAPVDLASSPAKTRRWSCSRCPERVSPRVSVLSPP